MDGKELKGYGMLGFTIRKDSEAYKTFKNDYEEQGEELPNSLGTYDLDGIKITVVAEDGDA